jgi:pimeloyl-ACP methyl ester carboxylesterase
LLWLGESRSIYEFGFSLLAAPLLLSAPRGDGHPVLVLPGFLASDASTDALRRYLRRIGYDAQAWKLGRNVGGVNRMRDALRRRLAEVQAESGRTVSLIGWSLGGVYARLLAVDMPELVRSVITYGSPFTRDPRASNVSDLYETLTGGIVNWRSSLLRPSERSENIEVLGASHIGLGVNAAVLWATADRLAQPEGMFAPFGRGGPFARGYGALS